MIDIILAMFLPGTQYQDHGENQCEWWVQSLLKLIDYFLQSDYQYFCHRHQSKRELVADFICGLMHKMKTVEKPSLFL